LAADDFNKPSFVDMNPFGVVEDDEIPGPRVMLEDDEIGSDSPGKTSWVVIVVVAVGE
jgi:hypothetical protein